MLATGSMRAEEGRVMRAASAVALLFSMSALLLLATLKGNNQPRTEAHLAAATVLSEVETSRTAPKSLLAESLLQALGSRAERLAPEMTAEDVASILDAYVHLDAQPGDSLFTALLARGQQVMPQMTATDIAHVLNACGRMHKAPSRSMWGELENHAHKVAGNMGPQEVADSLNAFILLGKLPSPELSAELRARATQVVPGMGSQAVAETVNSAAEMDMTSDTLWDALGERAQEVARHFTPEEVISTLQAYSHLRKQPPNPLWTALSEHICEEAHSMVIQDVAPLLAAYANASKILKRTPEKNTTVALKARATEMMDSASLTELRHMYHSLNTLEELRIRRHMHESDSRPVTTTPLPTASDPTRPEAHLEEPDEAASQQIRVVPGEDPKARGGEGRPNTKAGVTEDEAEVIKEEEHAEVAGDAVPFPLPDNVILSPQ